MFAGWHLVTTVPFPVFIFLFFYLVLSDECLDSDGQHPPPKALGHRAVRETSMQQRRSNNWRVHLKGNTTKWEDLQSVPCREFSAAIGGVDAG